MNLATPAVLALTSLCMSACIWDVNGDGKIVVACLGDSNTAEEATTARNPGAGRWCETLRARYPAITFVNYAISGARAIDGRPSDGLAQIERAAAGEYAPDNLKADFVILSFLTNDIGATGAITPEEGVRRIETLVAAAQSHGMQAFVATVPPRFDRNPPPPEPCTPSVRATPVIEATNALLRTRIDPLWLVDFDTGFACPTDYRPGDGVHLNAHEKRADRAAAALLRVPG